MMYKNYKTNGIERSQFLKSGHVSQRTIPLQRGATDCERVTKVNKFEINLHFTYTYVYILKCMFETCLKYVFFLFFFFYKYTFMQKLQILK